MTEQMLRRSWREIARGRVGYQRVAYFSFSIVEISLHKNTPQSLPFGLHPPHVRALSAPLLHQSPSLLVLGVARVVLLEHSARRSPSVLAGVVAVLNELVRLLFAPPFSPPFLSSFGVSLWRALRSDAGSNAAATRPPESPPAAA